MSEIKVNKISPKQTCTQLTLGDSGDTIIVPSGVNLNTDAIKNLNTSSIITQTNATTITLGYSGATIAIASGASQTGFGRTGTVNWDTTKKTTGFTAVSGNGYFCDTNSAAFTATLPATPTAGDIVAFSDYTGTWGTNNLTIGRNSSNINGSASNFTCNVNNSTAFFIYVDATEGWRLVNTGAFSNVNSSLFVAATGGTVLTCGDYKTHVFTGPGTFTVSCAGNTLGSNSVEYLVVAGGGGAGYNAAGGGGAGGYRQNYPSPATAGLPVTATAYPITVGAGGAAGCGSSVPLGEGVNGNNSVFSTITSNGGGGGGRFNAPLDGVGKAGGSGGGAMAETRPGGRAGGAGNSPPTSPSQGNPGGTAPCAAGAGGGGASVAGSNSNGINAGNGGEGSPIATAFFGPTAPSYGTPGPAPGRYFAGGGGGSAFIPGGTSSTGGAGGGGTGANNGGDPGDTNTGGGGGANNFAIAGGNSGAGGSGIVVIRYKFQ